jgi:hypothetical protein
MVFKASALLGFACLLSPSVVAQKARPAAGGDPFIAAIETIKQSVGSMDCLAVSGANAKILKRLGTGFLISEAADFLTAAHVVRAMQKADDPCPTPAITLPVAEWRPDAPTEQMLWFPFNAAVCGIDNVADVAICRPSGDLPARIRSLHKAVPVQFAWNIQRDGTQLALTGFPLEARDPMTFRSHVAAYQTPWPEQSMPQLVLDHASLPGFSGSPVFLADGRVVAILVRDGNPDSPGTSIARPVSAFQEMLTKARSR